MVTGFALKVGSQNELLKKFKGLIIYLSIYRIATCGICGSNQIMYHNIVDSLSYDLSHYWISR